MTAHTLLRTARKTAGLSQVELAGLSAVRQEAISRVEGGRDPRFSTWERLVDATGHRVVLVPTRRATVSEVAGQIAADLKAGRRDHAFRALIQLGDNLAAEEGLIRGHWPSPNLH